MQSQRTTTRLQIRTPAILVTSQNHDDTPSFVSSTTPTCKFVNPSPKTKANVPRDYSRRLSPRRSSNRPFQAPSRPPTQQQWLAPVDTGGKKPTKIAKPTAHVPTCSNKKSLNRQIANAQCNARNRRVMFASFMEMKSGRNY